MNKRLYVGNLPYSVTDESLRELFAQVGEVASASVIKDRDSGRSKGFGFVEMATDELAEQAMAKFNGYMMNGRPLSVSEARPMAPREGGPRGGGGGRRDRGERRD
jgi:RNA recognition motif-containing protein